MPVNEYTIVVLSFLLTLPILDVYRSHLHVLHPIINKYTHTHSKHMYALINVNCCLIKNCLLLHKYLKHQYLEVIFNKYMVLLILNLT